MGHTDWHLAAEQASAAVFGKTYKLAQKGKINLILSSDCPKIRTEKGKIYLRKKYIRKAQKLQN
jgi:hypothetical protein